MILFQVEGVQKHYGPEPVLDGVTFELRPGERIGLVGPNGTGKTTLMRILADREEADGGSIVRHPTLHVGYLEQQPEWEPGRTLLDEAKSALAGLMALEEELISVAEELGRCDDPLEHKRLADRYDHLQHEMQTRDAYNLDHKIERVLDGLRFRRESFNQPVESLSGGEQNRLMLAKLLLAEPNVMLLDEPSNHLDIEATEWLESFLAESAAAMLLVSHDRYFLDRVTNRTLELFQGTVDSYTGNFSAYWTQKAERLLVSQRTYERQQIEIEKAKDFIRRNHYGQKHQQAEDRRKKLDRIELVAVPRVIVLPPMGFPPASRSGDIVVRAKGLAKAFERPLFSHVDLQINRGERWGLLGPNGCGKSTLLRCLLGEQQPDAGAVQIGAGVSIGYFDQHLSGISDDDDVLDSHPAQAQAVLHPTTPRPAGPLRHYGRHGLAEGGQAQRRRAEPRGLGPAGGGGCQFPRARRADEPPRSVGPRRPGTGPHGLRRHRALREPRPLLRQPRGRPPDHLRAGRRAGDRGQLRGLSALPAEQVRPTGVPRAPPRRSRPLRTANPARRKDACQATCEIAGQAVVQARIGQGCGRAGPRGRARRKVQGGETGTVQRKKNRRFPFRKLSDIEGEIFQRESRIEQINEELADQATFREGGRARALKQELADQQSALKKLYEHWDEASEMNW